VLASSIRLTDEWSRGSMPEHTAELAMTALRTSSARRASSDRHTAGRVGAPIHGSAVRRIHQARGGGDARQCSHDEETHASSKGEPFSASTDLSTGAGNEVWCARRRRGWAHGQGRQPGCSRVLMLDITRRAAPRSALLYLADHDSTHGPLQTATLLPRARRYLTGTNAHGTTRRGAVLDVDRRLSGGNDTLATRPATTAEAAPPCCSAALRQTDVVARLAGDEFVVC